jgi:signal transduction histidine kinase
VIGRDFAPDDPRADVVAEIQNQVRRLNDTVQDLLTFARPTNPRVATLDVKEFCERILRVLAEEPVLKRHRVDMEIEQTTKVDADPQLLENILLNLLLNAGQAMAQRPGRIVVRAETETDRVRISVSDTGPGIPEDVLPSLFKPFFTTKVRGTGLGLAIVRKFVGALGGRIEVQTHAGEGTTFTVVLPRAKEEAAVL